MRDAKATFPKVFKANAIIGNFLRFELLSRYNQKEKLIQEVKNYYGFMAKITGTLWEHNDTRASTNHGFASHVAHVFYRDILGIKHIDPINKNIVLSFVDLPLEWCDRKIPLGEDLISVKWWKESGKKFYKVEVPHGYTWEVDKQSEKGAEYLP